MKTVGTLVAILAMVSINAGVIVSQITPSNYYNYELTGDGVLGEGPQEFSSGIWTLPIGTDTVNVDVYGRNSTCDWTLNKFEFFQNKTVTLSVFNEFDKFPMNFSVSNVPEPFEYALLFGVLAMGYAYRYRWDIV